MIFAKNNPIPGDCGDRYKGVFEYMFCFSKGRPKTFNPITQNTKKPGQLNDRVRLEQNGRNTLYGNRYVLKETRKAGNIFYYSVGQNGDDAASHKHPAVFPLQLALDQISTWSNEGDLVYDCFMGSGTTAIAAVKLGRNYIGSEISEEYTQLATERIRRETELPLLDSLDRPLKTPDASKAMKKNEGNTATASWVGGGSEW